MENNASNSRNETGGLPTGGQPQTGENYTKVEVERMETEGPAGTGKGVYVQQVFTPAKAPVLPAWICLILAWLFLGSSIPFTIFIGLPLNLGAIVLAMVCLSRSKVVTGVLILILGTIGSVIVYMIGLALFLGGISGGRGLF